MAKENVIPERVQGDFKMYKNKTWIVFSLLLASCIFSCSYGSKLAIVQRGVKKFATYFKNFSEIETDRLILRKVQPTDLEDVYDFLSDSEMTKYTPLFELAKSKDDAVKFIQNVIGNYEKGEPTCFAVVYKENNKLVGLIYLDIESCYRGSISYLVNRNYWSRGIATEAAKAIIIFGFEVMGLKRIEATCDPRNIASVRVLEKCGMQFEGLLRSYFCIGGTFYDRRLYAVIK